ncbi:uncharacterized protein [Parasteatoda tepidariorum]|uniref:uncharacterized protein isoform X2 n=1 Tax=Parasteatoda tepidariorum TaxID=114398 RepID=UPI0039BD7E8C
MSSFDSDEENAIEKTKKDSKVNKDQEAKLEDDLKLLQVKETNSNSHSSTTEKESDETLLPSDIDHIDYTYYPARGVNEEDEEKRKGGKWLLFAEGDLEKIDHRWIVLRSLIENGTLVCIKSSTAADREKGVTMCYTSASDNEEEVKRAADEIRKLVNYEYVMFYKTNAASAEGRYIDAGKKEISIYMHTFEGGFYKRDKYNRWNSI